jgi:hypothetical protein
VLIRWNNNKFLKIIHILVYAEYINWQKIWISSRTTNKVTIARTGHSINTRKEKQAGVYMNMSRHQNARLTDWLTDYVTNSMEQSLSWEANSHAASQVIARLYGNKRFITVLTKACLRICVTFRNRNDFYGDEAPGKYRNQSYILKR